MHAPPPPETQATLQRYALSILGLGLVLIVVYVSASLNWSFGYSLGRTPEDAKLYGLASVAAEAHVPVITAATPARAQRVAA
jgi:hypothetical protein